jgi:hypothetical protein
MSLQVTNQQSERQQLVLLRRQSVFMFIVTHLDATGCFSGSDQYVANTVAVSNRLSVLRARQSLIDTGDLLVIETDRRWDKATGKLLPNRVRPVSTRTFWKREWVRNGSKTDADSVTDPGSDFVTLSESRGLGDKVVSRTRVNDSKDAGSSPVSTSAVNKVNRLVHEHKNSITAYRSTGDCIEELQQVAYSAGSRELGDRVRRTFDPPVKRHLDQLRRALSRARASLKRYPSSAKTEMPLRHRAEIKRIEAEIAELEGVQ